ncbi:MAG: hypothetical protein LUF68_06235 [Clostridiales bacterium]|nr:hypothetical protein [Clostridiales bacterium]
MSIKDAIFCQLPGKKQGCGRAGFPVFRKNNQKSPSDFVAKVESSKRGCFFRETCYTYIKEFEKPVIRSFSEPLQIESFAWSNEQGTRGPKGPLLPLSFFMIL